MMHRALRSPRLAAGLGVALAMAASAVPGGAVAASDGWSAQAVPGPFRPVDGGCLSADRSFGCRRARGMENPFDIALSPDGRSAYVPSDSEPTLAVLSLSPRTGAVRQPRGRAGCLAARRLPKADGPFGVRYGRSCTRVRGVAGDMRAAVVSPDGRFVYVTSGYRARRTITIFARRANGTLRQLPGRAGCMASRAMDGCRVHRRREVGFVSMGPDGAQAYVQTGGTIATMARDERTGALAPSACVTTSATPGCTRLGARLASPGGPSWSPDGRFGYVSAIFKTPHQLYAVIVTVAREPRTGALTPIPGSAGCVTSAQLPACTHDPRLGDVTGPPVIPADGRNAYASASPISYTVPLGSDTQFAVVGYGRAEDGTLVSAGAPCLSRLPRTGCIVDRHVARVGDMQVAPSGSRLYLAAGSSVAAFDRDASSGALAFSGAIRGCASFRPCRGRAPFYEAPLIAAAPNGRFLYIVSSETYKTGTFTTLAVRSP